jgi:molybdate/tungstate transport system substrate-binding protein
MLLKTMCSVTASCRWAQPCVPTGLTKNSKNWIFFIAMAAILIACLAGESRAAPPAATGPSDVTLIEYGAGTLAVPFKVVNAEFEKANPSMKVQAQFGGSVKMAKQITELHEPADLLGVADYNVIPQQLYGRSGRTAYANWYIGFVSNAITFVYNDKSKGASNINSDNWYRVLAEPGVEIGRSNPDTDPSGYQTLQMLQLAEKHYHQPGLAQAILKNAPKKNIRDTETELIGALESGQIDYLAIYRSDAMQHHFKFLRLPPQIDLSDASQASEYAKVSVHTKNGDLHAKPIIYAVTIPTNAPHPKEAEQWIAFLLGQQGQSVMEQKGFVVIHPAIASGLEKVPAAIKPLVKPWPEK